MTWPALNLLAQKSQAIVTIINDYLEKGSGSSRQSALNSACDTLHILADADEMMKVLASRSRRGAREKVLASQS
ncbi:hypothetical protein HW509_04490 [Asaia spathodeae]|uniref:hypothetical protein n=1 Tax=Asaia spathodeae TaxID=657016 RepID=UPI002FC34804